MKILMINYEYPPLGGGGGVATQDIARELARRHTVHVLTSSATGAPKKESEADCDLTIFRARVLSRNAKSTASITSMLSFYPFGIAEGTKLVKKYGYDVINTMFAIPSGPTGVHLSKRHCIPHLLTIVGGDIYDPTKWYSPHRNPLLKPVVKRVLSKADRHTAISHDIERRARQFYKFDREIEVIPLGIKMPKFSPASREQLGLDINKQYAITVGRLVRRKDLPTLIRALHLLQRPELDLIVLGDGPELDNLKAIAQELGVSTQIQFRGFVPEELKYQLLTQSDVFALPSLHEGFGLVFIEAMHCGLPVVATTNGGQEDFLQDGKTGFMVASGDPLALKNALARVLDDSEWAARSGEENKRLAEQYSVENTALRYEELLIQTCSSYL
ncbi:MAG: glycosyltransferase family 4 protein [Pirellulales bacterium]